MVINNLGSFCEEGTMVFCNEWVTLLALDFLSFISINSCFNFVVD